MIKQAFQHSPLFIPFIMAGHPTLEISLQAIIALIESGSDIIELGVPFSDPVADGFINQRAAEIALGQGVNLPIILALVKEVRLRGYHTPIVLFSYLNPILAMGLDQFGLQAKEAGVNGVLIVDLPPEAGENLYTKLRQTLEIVLLTSPTTDPKRIELYKSFDPAFIYHISRCGVTGIQDTLTKDLEQEVTRLRSYFPSEQKIAVGFGISTPEQAKHVASFSDGVIVGSKLVQVLEQEGLESFKMLIEKLRVSIKFLY